MKKRKLAGIIIIAFVILLSMTFVYSSAYLTDMDKKDSIVLKSAKLKNEIAVELLQNHIDSTASTATMAFTLTNESNVAIKNSLQITANFDMSNSGIMYNDKISAVYFYPGEMTDAAIVTDIGNGGTAAYARTNLSSEKIKVSLPDIMVDKESSKLVNVKIALKGSDLSGYGNVLSLEITAVAGTQNSGVGYGFTEDLGSNNLILYDNINTANANNVIVNGIQTIREVKLSGIYGDVSSSSAPFANLYSVLPIRDADKISIANDISTFRKYGLTLSNGKLYGTLSAVSDGTSDDAVSFSYKSNNKNAGTAYIKIKIDKADSSITTAPTANSLTYTGSAQTLTTSGSCSGGTLYYRLYSYQSNTASSATVYNNSYSTTKPTGTAAGTYVVQYYVMGDSNHNDTGVSSVTVTIARADFTATVSIDGYTYGGTKSTPSVSNNPGGATVTYYGRSTSTGAATSWSSVTSTTYNVGTRYCYAVIAETNNYSSYTTANTSFTISKGASSVTTSPTANSLTYSGSAQTLTTVGSCSGGTLYYRLYSYKSNTASSATTYNNSYSTTRPTGTDAGTYVVQYYVAGDSNHNDTGVSTVTVTISRASFTATVSISGYAYGGTKSTPTVSNNPGGGTVTYYGRSTSSGTATAWSSVTSTTYNAGTRYCYAVIAATNNYSSYTTSNTSFTISKADFTATVSISGYTYGGTKSTPSVSNNPGSGTVTYYGRSTSSGTATAWSSVTSTTYDAGTRYCYAVIAATTNYNSYTTANTSFTIAKASFTSTVSISGYTYGGTKSTPSVSNNPGGGSVTYYGRSTSIGTATIWSSVTNTTYDAGTRYCYAVIAATTNYNSYTTANTSFTIAKASQSAPTSLTASVDGTTVTLTASGSGKTSLQYSKDGTTWQTSRVFSDCFGSITFYARYAAGTNYNASSSKTTTVIIRSGLWTDYAASGFAGGSGTSSDPFQIATAEQFAYLAKISNEASQTNVYYSLTSDIDLTAHYWVPICGISGHFNGVFRGNEHSISGLKVDEEGTYDAAGLFGQVAVPSDINDISLIEPIVSNKHGRYAGAVCGLVSNTNKDCIVLNNIYVYNPTVESQHSAGACVGYCYVNNYAAQFNDIYIDGGNVKAGSYACGLIGCCSNPLVECNNTNIVLSSVSATNCAGISWGTGKSTGANKHKFTNCTVNVSSVVSSEKSYGLAEYGMGTKCVINQWNGTDKYARYTVANSVYYDADRVQGTLSVLSSSNVKGMSFTTANIKSIINTLGSSVWGTDGTNIYYLSDVLKAHKSLVILNSVSAALPSNAVLNTLDEQFITDTIEQAIENTPSVPNKISDNDMQLIEEETIYNASPMPTTLVDAEENSDITDTPLPSPTPDGSPSPSVVPANTHEPSAEPSPEALPTPTVTAEPTIEPSPVQSETLIITTTPRVEQTVLPTSAPTPTPTVTPESTPISAVSPMPTESPSALMVSSFNGVWDSSLVAKNTVFEKILSKAKGVMPG